MLIGNEKWVGPFQIRAILEASINAELPKPPATGSAYIVTRRAWQTDPDTESHVLYVGGNTGKPGRFRTRVGDLLADALGFFTKKTSRHPGTGHHSGGMSLHQWCKDHSVNPLDLYIAWVEGSTCHRCLEIGLYRKLSPELCKKAPARCRQHKRPPKRT